jgi:hypothetical protein
VEKSANSGAPADKAGQVTGLEVIDELKRAWDAIREDALVNARHTGGNGEAKKNSFFATALSDYREGVAEVFE